MKFNYLLTFLATSCSGSSLDFSERERNFSIELLHFTQLEQDGHVIISPFGIWSLMTGITLGATGESRNQLTRAFFLPRDQNKIINGYSTLTKAVLDPDTKGVSLTSRNFMFLDKGFTVLPKFENIIQNDFGATITKLNFREPSSAAKYANDMIQDSGASVSNVLRSDDFAESRMILTNVISFKGLWSSPFNTTDTTVEPFYDENKREIGKVNMMYQQAQLPFSNIQSMKSCVLELPYGNDNKYCMLVILPYPKIKVDEVYQKFTTISFLNIFEKLQIDEKNFGLEVVDVKLPRFKISTNVVLNKPLNNMNVYNIFDPRLASFERITSEEIHVSAIIHKADIEVTESGTVASASSSANYIDRMLPPNFEVNRPFIYFVMEKPTATVIFGGIYSKPSMF